MLIVTCVKQVPDTTQVKVDPVTGTLIREGVPFIMNPYDTHALEESLRLKDKYGFRVAVISMGPPSAEVTLRKTIALGADEAILLSDRILVLDRQPGTVIAEYAVPFPRPREPSVMLGEEFLLLKRRIWARLGKLLGEREGPAPHPEL